MSGCGRTPGEDCGCDCGGARMRARQAEVMDEVVAALPAQPRAVATSRCGGMPGAAAPEPGGIGLAAEAAQL